ncbi:unnamed protein product [Spirodela intermedia]|uniref:non-specific serine/threonine protein kinase n=1 Tax=Spirodela intermedia TaxID=51605 RepID=A0A7I8IIT7_SPIIN|nr:unnamed protein product [Spirodela intermedia]CAA6657646.1 unnamed protein product [Spirodela intermedia]
MTKRRDFRKLYRDLKILISLPTLFINKCLCKSELERQSGRLPGRPSEANEPREAPDGLRLLPAPIRFRSSPTGNISSFSSAFVFAIVPDNKGIGGHGIAFVISPTKDFRGATSNQYFGIFNKSSSRDEVNHIFAVELDTIHNRDMEDINDNHVGIDINSYISFNSSPAGYFDDDSGRFNELTLISGNPLQAWVDYDASERRLNVTLSPTQISKPKIPLISAAVDLTNVLSETMYVGFSSSTGSFRTSHYLLGWSFRMNGMARALDPSTLPPLPRHGSSGRTRAADIWVPIVVPLFEEWEADFSSQRISYKDLYYATKGVYGGVMAGSKQAIAVKIVAQESTRGMKEFIREISTIGQLRHRNLVQLLGYCRRKGELLLVYDFMPNSSLDKFLHDPNHPTLSWAQRFRVVKDVGAGLLYMHEEWEMSIIHRDIKASNVLLDGEFNGRLGDFSLARLYDNEDNNPTSTRMLLTTGVASKATDVFSFGAFLLEVACGRRPLDSHTPGRTSPWGAIRESVDGRLGSDYSEEEVELVLKLGLLCSHYSPARRPCMRQVVQYLGGAAELPELVEYFLDSNGVESLQTEAIASSLGAYENNNGK